MKKTYLVISPDEEHEYNIIVEETMNGTQYSIKRSKNNIFHDYAKSELLLSMLDTGNGVEFDRDIDVLDYEVSFCLKTLLNFEALVDLNPANKVKYKIVRAFKVGKI